MAFIHDNQPEMAEQPPKLEVHGQNAVHDNKMGNKNNECARRSRKQGCWLSGPLKGQHRGRALC
eukprot:1157284-Pelagomonas_calceolata.AAC.1